jgi:hypothetical protein
MLKLHTSIENRIEDKISYLDKRIAFLQEQRKKLKSDLRKRDEKKTLIKKAQNRARYLAKNHDFLTFYYDTSDESYWVESDSPVHVNDGSWDEDGKHYIDASDRHIHEEDDNSHWLDIVWVCERIVSDVINK